MTLKQLCSALNLKTVCGDTEREFDGVYAGDLLSRAMSHVQSGNLWLTIMSNTNVVAVASLSDASAVILAEGVSLIPEALDAARENLVTVLSSDKTVYELCSEISRLI